MTGRVQDRDHLGCWQHAVPWSGCWVRSNCENSASCIPGTPAFFCMYQFSSVAQSCPTLCDPMDCSTPGFPVHHQLPELAQTHVHRVSDAIQPSHPLSSPSPPPPSFPASGSFSVSQFFASAGQSIYIILQWKQLRIFEYQWYWEKLLQRKIKSGKGHGVGGGTGGEGHVAVFCPSVLGFLAS